MPRRGSYLLSPMAAHEEHLHHHHRQQQQLQHQLQPPVLVQPRPADIPEGCIRHNGQLKPDPRDPARPSVSMPKPPGYNNWELTDRRGPWSAIEDKDLLYYINSEENPNWVTVSHRMVVRNAKQCRERFHQNLHADLKHGPLSDDEGRLVLHLVEQDGKCWAAIARRLPGRSDNQIKNWWNGEMNRRRRASRRAAIDAARAGGSCYSKTSASEQSQSPTTPVAQRPLPLPMPARKCYSHPSHAHAPFFPPLYAMVDAIEYRHQEELACKQQYEHEEHEWRERERYYQQHQQQQHAINNNRWLTNTPPYSTGTPSSPQADHEHELALCDGPSVPASVAPSLISDTSPVQSHAQPALKLKKAMVPAHGVHGNAIDLLEPPPVLMKRSVSSRSADSLAAVTPPQSATLPPPHSYDCGFDRRVSVCSEASVCLVEIPPTIHHGRGRTPRTTPEAESKTIVTTSIPRGMRDILNF